MRLSDSDFEYLDRIGCSKERLDIIRDNHKSSELCRELVNIIIDHCGETGENEGAIETLNRIVKNHAKLLSLIKEIETEQCTSDSRQWMKKYLKFNILGDKNGFN